MSRYFPNHILTATLIHNPMHTPQSKGIDPHQIPQLIQIVLWFLLFLSAASLEQSAQAETLDSNTQAGLMFNGESAFHMQSHAHVSIQAMAASVTLTQQFKNISEQTLNGEYILPLAEDAAVSNMVIRIGEREIRAQIKTKPQAKKIYQQAQKSGKKAALIEQHRENIFKQHIANIGAGETIEIEIQWQQGVEYLDGQYSWRLPMTLTPRYSPMQVGSAPTQSVDTLLHFPQQNNDGWHNQLSLDIELETGFKLKNIQSLFNEIAINKRDLEQYPLYQIQPKSGAIAMDQDFVLQWQAADQSQVQIGSFLQDDYLITMLSPSLTTEQNRKIARDSLFIIDISGSMAGTSITQAKAALKMAINALDSQDTFNIIRFNHQSSALYAQSQYATQDNKRDAIAYIQALQADGGTEMLPALQLAQQLSQPSASQTPHDEPQHSRVQQVFFITDGSISNERQLLNLIQEGFKQQRIFTIAIGSAPNHFFMRKAAQIGRGSHLVINDIKQVYKSMQSLFKQLKNPVLSHIEVELKDMNGKRIQAQTYPQKLPDLYLGQPLLVSSKLNADYEALQIIITAKFGHKTMRFERIINNKKATNLALSQLWARAKIEDLTDLKYQQRHNPQAQQDLINAITSTALEHQLVSAYTSLVAVEEAPSTSYPANKTAAISNLKPKGQTLALPQTATAKQSLYFSALLLLIAAVLIKTFNINLRARMR